MLENSLLLKKNGRGTLLIAFSSFDLYRRENGKFDYYSFSRREDIDILLVRDLNNTWYFYPGYNISDDKDHECLLSEIINISSQYQRVICVGSSMGGFAAIYFGQKISNCTILSFSPQVNIDIEYLNRHGDMRQRAEISIVNDRMRNKKQLNILNIDNPHENKFFVYFGKNDVIDSKFAAEMACNKTFTVSRLPYVNHGLIHVIHASNTLNELMESLIIENKLIDIEKNIRDFQKNINHDLYLLMPIEYDPHHCKLTFTLHVDFANESFWIYGGDISIAILVYNENIGRHVYHESFRVSKSSIKCSTLTHRIELDFS
ncbi:YqiA/YcfP family alpha/beta fold hydrolase, partial [Acetobacter fabarum]